MSIASEVSALLVPLVTRSRERLLGNLAAAEAIPPEVIGQLTAAVEESADYATTAAALGDVLRRTGHDRNLVNEFYRAAFYLGDDWREAARNPLFAYFSAHRTSPVIDKWVHYFDIYHRHLGHLRDQPVKVLEIGVYRGGGLDMWRWYFGPEASLLGLDVDPAAVEATAGRHTVRLGDQADPEFLAQIDKEYGPFDVIIDDGGHTMEQQIVSVETLFPLLPDGGIYIVEDCHTSYWPSYGGGPSEPGSFIEWTKSRIDDLHAHHHPGGDTGTVWAEDVSGIHAYDSVIVLDKQRRFAPFNEVMGTGVVLAESRPEALVTVELVDARDTAMRERDALAAEQRGGDARPAGPRAGSGARRTSQASRGRVDAVRNPDFVEGELRQREAELTSAEEALAVSHEQLREMRRTVSWRVTAPLRALRRVKRG